MKKIFLKIVIGVVLVCILFVCFLYTNNEIGVTSSKLVTDIRSSQKLSLIHILYGSKYQDHLVYLKDTKTWF